ncbi:response regulator [bacterium]|nr:response regulator [bacterium]
MRMLLVEDTEDVAAAVVESFARRGDAVDHVGTVADAVASLAVLEYDITILDIQLPDGEGTEILRILRQTGRAVPVLMLTARGEVDARIAALDQGADDYMVKPFDLGELHARVRALVRRNGTERAGIIAYGDITFDPAARELTVAGQPVTLTRREYSLLEVLLTNRGRVVAKDHIHDRMFSFNDEEVGLNSIETYVARLRRKIEGSHVTIRTLRGLGYQLVADG